MLSFFMASPPNDTSPEAEEVQLQLFRDAPSWRKLEMAFALNRSLRRLIVANAGVKAPEDRHRLLAERWLGSDLAKKVYGPLQSR